MIKLDINKPLSVEESKLQRSAIKAKAIKNFCISLPVLLTYILFLICQKTASQYLDGWVQSLSSIKAVAAGLSMVLMFFLLIVLLVSFAVLFIAINTLCVIDVLDDAMEGLQEAVRESGDKVCAKYLVDVHDMGRLLLFCEKKIILQRIEDVKKENEINKLRNML